MNSHRHITIKDIAERLGISHSTVSRALSDYPKAPVNADTRKRVRETARKMGYSPNLMARGVATGKSGTLGLIAYDISSFAGQLQGFIREAHRAGYQILMGLSTRRGSQDLLDDPQLQIRQMLSHGVDGLLVHTQGYPEDGERIQKLVRGRIPVVAFSYPIEGVSSVVLDRKWGFYKATEHLIQLGHREIGYIGPHWNNRDLTATKGQGYFQAMKDQGLSPRWVEGMGISLEDGYRLGMALGRSSNMPTALVCRTDDTAIGVCRGLQQVGVRIPEDVAIVGGGDNGYSAFFEPALTTQQVPHEAICQAAICLMMAQLKGQMSVRQVIVQPYLILRASCGSGVRI